MIVEMLKTAGIKLFTKGKHCDEDISIVPRLQQKSVSANGTYTPDVGYVGLSALIVNVPTESGAPAPVLQEKEITVTENGIIDITPDIGYTGLSKVRVIVNLPITPVYDGSFEKGVL